MQLVLHRAFPGTVPSRGRKPYKFQAWTALGAIAVVLAASAMALSLNLSPVSSASLAAVPAAVTSSELPEAFANPVDWSLIEPSPDPGPAATAAYGF